MDNFLPGGLAVIDRSSRSPIARAAISATLPCYPNTFVGSVTIFADPAKMRSRMNGRVCYVEVVFNSTAAKNRKVGRAMTRMVQATLAEPFKVEAVDLDTLRAPLPLAECSKIAESFFGASLMVGIPKDAEFAKALTALIAGRYGDAEAAKAAAPEPEAKPKAAKKPKGTEKVQED